MISDATWWLIPLSKWVITPVISGLTLLIPLITGVITHLLSGVSHQVNIGKIKKMMDFIDHEDLIGKHGGFINGQNLGKFAGA